MHSATPGTGSTRDLLWSQLGDEILARRAAAGSDGAFTALYARYHGPLLTYCRSILLNAEDAHDATQTALENALRALPRRDAGRPLRPWLYRIAHNEAVTLLRRRQRHDELGPDTEPTISVPAPEIYAEQRSRLEQLVEDLRALPDRQRGALVMRELSGLSYEEIGAALGLTAPNARRAVYDARSALLDVAGGRDAECVTIRHALSDGDRRSVRARRIRAHLRSCDGCSSFQAGIGARRADLPAISPWLPGAAAVSALGIGAGGATGGGGALVATGGGGLGWTVLSGGAMKSLAVVAVVATTGTAALEIERAATPHRGQSRAQAATPSPHRAAADPRRSATTAAAVAGAADRRAARRGNATSGPTPASRHGSSISTSHGHTDLKPEPATSPKSPEPHAPATNVTYNPPPPPPAAAAKPQAADPPTAPSQTLADKLTAIQAQIMAAISGAQTAGAGGTQSALHRASTLVAGTLSSVQALVKHVLASFGISVPSSVGSAPKPPVKPATLSGVLAPVQQMLGGVTTLLAQLFGKK